MFRNKAVLRDCPYITLSTPNQVNLNAWTVPNSTNSNVGDFLSFVVVENVCRIKGIDFHKKIQNTRHLYAVGSILLGFQDATIWGSGFGYTKPKRWYSPGYNCFHRHYHQTDIRAVRGPETRHLLMQMGIDCPKVYGDPAVLMPLFYQGKRAGNPREYVVIPHYSKFEKYSDNPNAISTFSKDYRTFIDSMLEANLVISSSLHGIVLAEAYGIPAVMLSDTPSTDILKYRDYYSSTGRSNFPVATSIKQALELGGTPVNYSALEQMQNRLLDTFPVDLWD